MSKTRDQKLIEMHEYVQWLITHYLNVKKRGDVVYLVNKRMIEEADLVSQCFLKCLEYEKKIDFDGTWKGYVSRVVVTQLEDMKKSFINKDEMLLSDYRNTTARQEHGDIELDNEVIREGG